MKKARDRNSWVQELWMVSLELKALAHLIRFQKCDGVPLDIEEINWGKGRLLERLAKRARRLSREIEASELENATTK